MKAFEVRKFKPGLTLGILASCFTNGEWLLDSPFCIIEYNAEDPRNFTARLIADSDYDVVQRYTGFLNQSREVIGGQKPVDHLTFDGYAYIEPEFNNSVAAKHIQKDGTLEYDWNGDPTVFAYECIIYTHHGTNYRFPGACIHEGSNPDAMHAVVRRSGDFLIRSRGSGYNRDYVYWDRYTYSDLHCEDNQFWYDMTHSSGYETKWDHGEWEPRVEKGCYVPLPLGQVIYSETPNIPDLTGYEVLLGNLPTIDPKTYTSLMENLQFKPDINNLENLSSLQQMRRLIPDVLKLLRGKVSTKLLADAHLTYNYGINTLRMDVVEAADHLLRSRPNDNVSSAVKSVVDNWHIRQSIYGASNPYSILDELGLSLNLSNLWDTVPYSFIVDWFANLGDVLESIDTAETMRQTHISAYLVSYSRETTASIPNIIGYCKAKRYVRKVYSALPQEYVSFSLKTPHPRHLLDGGAILRSRGK